MQVQAKSRRYHKQWQPMPDSIYSARKLWKGDTKQTAAAEGYFIRYPVVINQNSSMTMNVETVPKTFLDSMEFIILELFHLSHEVDSSEPGMMVTNCLNG